MIKGASVFGLVFPAPAGMNRAYPAPGPTARGVPRARGDEPILVELYRVQFDVGKTLALIQDKGIASPDMEGMLLIDTTKPADGDLGQFGRVVLLG